MASYKQKNGTWKADFYINGKRKRKSGFKTKRDSEQYADSQRQSGNTWKDRIEINNRTLTIKDLTERYRKHLAKTRSEKSAYIIDRIDQRFGSFIVAKLTPESIREWIRELFDQYAVGTVKLHLTYIKAVFKNAIKSEIISENPSAIVSFSKEFLRAGVRNTVLLPEQWNEFYNLFSNSRWYIRGIVLGLWHTGMRVSELLNLKWESVDLNIATITLDSTEVKESATRTIGIEPEFLDYLTELKKIHNRKGSKGKSHVFGITGDNPINYQTFYLTWKSTLKKSQFSHILIHDMRHSYVTRKRREGHDRELIKIQTGHRTNIMFERYNTIHQDEVIALSGIDKEKIERIREDVKMLMAKCHEHSISLNTLYTVIRNSK